MANKVADHHQATRASSGHPLGQTLIVTSGLGWVQREGGPIEEIRQGDVIWFPPERNIGMAQHQLQQWHTALFRRH